MRIPPAFTVEVTEQDIKMGQPQSTLLCPISFAVRRFFLENVDDYAAKDFAVATAAGRVTIHNKPEEGYLVYYHDGQSLIRDFDNRKKVAPVEVTCFITNPRPIKAIGTPELES